MLLLAQLVAGFVAVVTCVFLWRECYGRKRKPESAIRKSARERLQNTPGLLDKIKRRMREEVVDWDFPEEKKGK
jgi:hypothetical protein